MGLLWGRRRVGKTAILERFAASKRTVFHVASNRPRADELRTLSSAAAPLLDGGLRDLRERPLVDWVDAIETLAAGAVDEPLLLVLDEYPELTRGDQTLDSTLRAVWERVRGRSSLRILLCGSATRTMQALQAEPAPLYGRMDLRLLVHPFAPHEAALLLPGLPAAEQALVWGITDGVPLYLSWWDTDADIGTNLTRLVLDPSGLLRAEGDLVLATEGLAAEAAGRDYLPGQVLRALAAGRTTYSELRQAVRAEPARTLDALQALRLVERLTPVTDPQASRRRRYRITDNFLAFFLGVVERHRSEIDRGLGEVLLPTLSAELDEAHGRPLGARAARAPAAHGRERRAGGRGRRRAVLATGRGPRRARRRGARRPAAQGGPGRRGEVGATRRRPPAHPDPGAQSRGAPRARRGPPAGRARAGGRHRGRGRARADRRRRLRTRPLTASVRSRCPQQRGWYGPGMRATIDRAGRLVIPKVLRDRLGFVPGEVEVTPDGAALRVEAVSGDVLEERAGVLVVPSSGARLDDDDVRALRDADQR